MTSVKPKIAIIVFPLGKFSTEILAKFLTVLSPSSETIYVVSGNVPENRFNHKNVKFLKLAVNSALYSKSIWKRIAIHILDQLRLILVYKKIIKQTDMLILPISFNVHMLPLFFGKLMRKKIVVCSTGSSARSSLYLHKKTNLISKLNQVVEKVGYTLSDKVMIESSNVIKFNNLYPFEKKIVNGALYVDTQNFKLEKLSSQRTNTVAFVGRLTAEKGILEFAQAIPLVSAQNLDISFLIVGVGDLYETVSKQLAGYKNVKFTGGFRSSIFLKFLIQQKSWLFPLSLRGCLTCCWRLCLVVQ
jgi:glycosyltransferase involved in cell wall biosynthesis